jgi:thioredoxin 1
MAIVELDSSCFETTVSREGVLVVECWASWCGGCEMFEPTFEAVSRRHPDVRFAKLDTGSHPELTETVGVTQVPTLLVFRDGLLLLRHPGGVDETALEGIVAQAVALDMNVVRADMENEARKADRAVT